MTDTPNWYEVMKRAAVSPEPDPVERLKAIVLDDPELVARALLEATP